MQVLKGVSCPRQCSTALSGRRHPLVLRAPAVSRSRRTRGAVVVEANLFARAVRVIQSYANQIGKGVMHMAAGSGCAILHATNGSP